MTTPGIVTLPTSSIEGIKRLRGFKTDGELAELLGVHRTTISRWRAGQPISMDVLVRIMDAMGATSLDAIFQYRPAGAERTGSA
ncbi:helix-turn-helix transcriptional regulator [Nocardia sp. NBC_00511]|uniref:helix-turn-helix transcriptional regulator n=1 Tax=Nocardia sp. NBC_00511 TaxID=2903591 RepID=UPI0030E30F68